MNKFFFIPWLSFFLTVSFLGLGQERSVEISGTIIEAETNDPVPYVHVVNKSSGKGTVSNTEGRFWMEMAKTDTILFSAIGFEPYAFTLKEQVTSGKLIVTIELNTATMQLKPVKIFAFKDEHALKRALIAMDLPLEPKNKIILPQGVNTKEYTPEGGISITGPFSALHNAFSKEAKARRKLEKYQLAYDHQKMIRAKYNESIVLELTGLPEDKVEEFMEFCKLEDAFIERSSAYEIAVAVNRCLVDFK